MKSKHYFCKGIRFILCLSALWACGSVSAQDVIVTRDSKRIDASVQEISDTEVRYKRQDNPDGPVFVLKTSEIASIVFANGEVQSFENVGSQQRSEQSATPSAVNSQMYSDYPMVVSQGGRIIRYRPGGRLAYDGLHTTYDGVEIEAKTCLEFLKMTCPDAYNKYNDASTVGILAGGLLGAGASALLWGLIAAVIDEEGMRTGNATQDELDVDYAIVGAGAIGMLLSLPLFGLKVSLKNKSVEVFNSQAIYVPQRPSVASLTFSASPNSVGLCLNF